MKTKTELFGFRKRPISGMSEFNGNKSQTANPNKHSRPKILKFSALENVFCNNHKHLYNA